MEIRTISFCIRNRFEFFRYLIYLFLCLLTTACVSTSGLPLSLRIDAAKQLNPDASLTSLPVRVKIYQLSDPTAFNEATFQGLWKNDVNVLGNSLIEKKEWTINPGESQHIKINRQAHAEYLAVIAIFRQHEDNGWKAVKALPGHVNGFLGSIYISAKGHRVEIR